MIELKWQKDCMSMVGKEASVWLLNLDHTYKKFHYLRLSFILSLAFIRTLYTIVFYPNGHDVTATDLTSPFVVSLWHQQTWEKIRPVVR